MENSTKSIDVLWDDNPVDITSEANFIWSIANKLRGVYMPDKYGDVVIPMTIIRRLECALETTKDKVVSLFKEDPNIPEKLLARTSGFQFYNTSEFSLKELINDPDHIETNFISYINSFSSNVQQLLNSEDCLNMSSHIKTMNKGGCLYTVVKAFSELDLSPETYDSIKMGYIFENLIGRFFQNVDAGQYYTGRDIIKLCVSLLISEGADDLGGIGKVITVCDQACGTGGMLSTAYNYLKHYYPDSDVRLFGQELNGVSHAVGLAEMLIKGQRADNFRHVDTFKEDCFSDIKMRFVLENPPFGTPWKEDLKNWGIGDKKEVTDPRFFDGVTSFIPDIGDCQMLFLANNVSRMKDTPLGTRIVEVHNASSLFTGSAGGGESNLRKYIIENDLLEAIIAMPENDFFNTPIQTYIWIVTNRKEERRKGKVQLIDASRYKHSIRKNLGHKNCETTEEDRTAILNLLINFEENSESKIVKNEDLGYWQVPILRPKKDENGNVEKTSLSHIAEINEETARQLALNQYRFHRKSGMIEYARSSYYYKSVPQPDGLTVIGFLECTQEVRSVNAMRAITLLVCMLVVILFVVILRLLSRRAIAPYVENIISQKQFITNASHELKTPLAIISANAEAILLLLPFVSGKGFCLLD